MPILVGGDPNVNAVVNALEERVAALEAAIARLKKAGGSQGQSAPVRRPQGAK